MIFSNVEIDTYVCHPFWGRPAELGAKVWGLGVGCVTLTG